MKSQKKVFIIGLMFYIFISILISFVATKGNVEHYLNNEYLIYNGEKYYYHSSSVWFDYEELDGDKYTIGYNTPIFNVNLNRYYRNIDDENTYFISTSEMGMHYYIKESIINLTLDEYYIKSINNLEWSYCEELSKISLGEILDETDMVLIFLDNQYKYVTYFEINLFPVDFIGIECEIYSDGNDYYIDSLYKNITYKIKQEYLYLFGLN